MSDLSTSLLTARYHVRTLSLKIVRLQARGGSEAEASRHLQLSVSLSHCFPLESVSMI